MKKRTRKDDSADDGSARPTKSSRELTQAEKMQLRLIANLPSMQQPLRDHRGRRRATCVSSAEMVEAGLTALVSDHATLRAGGDDARTVAVPSAESAGGGERRVSEEAEDNGMMLQPDGHAPSWSEAQPPGDEEEGKEDDSDDEREAGADEEEGKDD